MRPIFGSIDSWVSRLSVIPKAAPRHAASDGSNSTSAPKSALAGAPKTKADSSHRKLALVFGKTVAGNLFGENDRRLVPVPRPAAPSAAPR